jgi:hypothetical protein
LDNYKCNTEYAAHGTQDMAYKVMKHLNSSERDTAFINNITKDDWLSFCKDLWINETDPELNGLMTVGPNELEELEGILISFKYKKSSGNDAMNIEFLNMHH